MTIHPDILLTYGASNKKLNKGDIIFEVGEEPRFYFQIVTGRVKVYSLNNQGKELIQGQFIDGESFGEPPLFVEHPYPSTAIACSDVILLKLSKEKFFIVLKENPELCSALLYTFAQRIYNKSITAQILNSHTPELKILGFLEKLKSEAINPLEKQVVPLTRQQIADSVGLRVETVIRTLIKLEKEQKLKIINHKVYY